MYHHQHQETPTETFIVFCVGGVSSISERSSAFEGDPSLMSRCEDTILVFFSEISKPKGVPKPLPCEKKKRRNLGVFCNLGPLNCVFADSEFTIIH